MKLLLRNLVLLLVRIIGAANIRTAPPVLRAPRILLVRPDHLGDLLMTTPILDAIRTQVPDAHITMMVGPWSQEVVARHPALNQMLTCAFPGFRRAAQKPLAPYMLLFKTARQLRQGHYDLALNLRPDFWWGDALLYLAGIPRRTGYAIEPGAPFQTHSLPFAQHEHATVSNLRLVSAGLQTIGQAALDKPFTPARYPLIFRPDRQEQAWADERLHQHGINEQTPIIIIHPGSGAAVKLWRSQGWSHVANLLSTSQNFPEPARIILTGSPQERPLLDEIARDLKVQPIICDQQSVGQLAALLQRAQLVLGVDNGPLHFAVAQNSPSLRIFGPTDVQIFGPWGDPQRHVVLVAQQHCAGCPAIPCGRLDFRTDELAAHPCVRNVSDQQVMETIRRLIQSQVTPTSSAP